MLLFVELAHISYLKKFVSEENDDIQIGCRSHYIFK